MSPDHSVHISIRISEEQAMEVKYLMAKLDREMSWTVREALRRMYEQERAEK